MPYLMQTSHMVADYFEQHGFELDSVATFDLDGDPEMNRFSQQHLFDAAVENCSADSDALFISCTGWRTRPIIDRLEQVLNKPVVTSNQALAWSALRRAGINQPAGDLGQLFVRA